MPFGKKSITFELEMRRLILSLLLFFPLFVLNGAPVETSISYEKAQLNSFEKDLKIQSFQLNDNKFTSEAHSFEFLFEEEEVDEEEEKNSEKSFDFDSNDLFHNSEILKYLTTLGVSYTNKVLPSKHSVLSTYPRLNVLYEVFII